jgi:hypothetical protein
MRLAWIAMGLLACSPAANENPCPSGLCGSNDGGGEAGPEKCQEAWSCTEWKKGADGKYTRTCTDQKACGTTTQKPIEGPVALPDLDMEYYKCNVEPIFDRGCGMMGCHGTEAGRPYKVYSRGRLRHSEQVPAMCLDQGPQDLAKGNGTVMCYGWAPHTQYEWQSNYDNARVFMVGVTDPKQSELVMQPKIGGKAHAGVHLFKEGDADYNTIVAWLGGAKLGSTCDTKGN